MPRFSQQRSEVEIPEVELSGIEGQLRQCAPDLPSRLKSRTLENCRARAEAQRRRQKRLHWQLVGAVAGVLAVQSMTLSLIDGQNMQLIAGNSQPPLFASLSFSEISQLWHQRSREVAQLMEPSQVSASKRSTTSPS